MVVSYGLPAKAKGCEHVICAVTLRPGRDLAAQDVTAALALIPPDERPAVVHVVDDVTVTTWYRPSAAELRTKGMPQPGAARWYYDAAKDAYRPLTQTARKKLVG